MKASLGKGAGFELRRNDIYQWAAWPLRLKSWYQYCRLHSRFFFPHIILVKNSHSKSNTNIELGAWCCSTLLLLILLYLKPRLARFEPEDSTRLVPISLVAGSTHERVQGGLEYSRKALRVHCECPGICHKGLKGKSLLLPFSDFLVDRKIWPRNEKVWAPKKEYVFYFIPMAK
jgi:hypothetical protein